jgi:hypothetical protein
MKKLLVPMLAAALAACSSPSYPTRVQPPSAPAPATPGPTATPAPAAPDSALRSPVPRPQAATRDQCGAAQMQGMVGRPRTEIPVPVDPGRQRVACTSCPVTEDYNPARLNFFFDADSGLIRQVRCG